MKQLTCEMCGSTELIKQDGFFVCQTCGTKYSVEEAKKLMVEGTVKVDNSDRIKNYLELARTAKDEDDSTTAAKYYALILEEMPNSWEAKFYSTYYAAMECKVKEAYEMCVKMEKLAHSILTSIKASEPTNLQSKYVIEIAEKMKEIAIMFAAGNSDSASKEVPDMLSLWGDQLEEKFGENAEITDKAADFWETAVSIIISTYGTGEKAIDDKIAQYSAKIKKYHANYEPPKSNLTYHTSDSPNALSVVVKKVGHPEIKITPIVNIPVTVLCAGPDSAGGVSAEIEIKNLRGNNIKYANVYVTAINSVGDPVECSIHHEATRCVKFTGPLAAGGKTSGTFENAWYNHSIVNAKIDHVDVIYDDDSIERYTASELSDPNATSSTSSGNSNGSGSSSGGCYVATCVYGSCDCPQVWTLRRYRDDTLGSTWYGRLFIRTYYAISPTLVKWFGNTNWFKKLWRGKLDRMVAKLQSNGVEDTPYEDKNW